MIGMFAFITGLFIGSFINVLADRLPNGEQVIRGRSHCDYCKKLLRWWELFPVLSFLLLGGRCRRCRHKLSWQYPLSEIATGILFAVIASHFFLQPVLLAAALITGCSLLVIFIADLKYQIIPDSMIVSGLLATLAWVLFATPGSFWIRVLTGLGTLLFFLLLWLATGGKGMGFGDVKLSFLLGFLAGYPGIVIALYIAFLTGAFIGVILMMTGKKTLKSRVAFGPFLLAGTALALQYGTIIVSWWKGVI